MRQTTATIVIDESSVDLELWRPVRVQVGAMVGPAGAQAQATFTWDDDEDAYVRTDGGHPRYSTILFVDPEGTHDPLTADGVPAGHPDDGDRWVTSGVSDYVVLGQAAGGDLAGTYPDPTIGASVLGDANWDATSPLGRDKIAPVSARTLVNDSGGAAPAFATTTGGTWSNFGGSYQVASFWLDEASEMVHIEGLVKATGTVGQGIFTLPVGFRPASSIQFSSFGYKSSTYTPINMEVLTSGVVVAGAAPPWTTFCICCAFRVAT